MKSLPRQRCQFHGDHSVTCLCLKGESSPLTLAIARISCCRRRTWIMSDPIEASLFHVRNKPQVAEASMGGLARRLWRVQPRVLKRLSTRTSKPWGCGQALKHCEVKPTELVNVDVDVIARFFPKPNFSIKSDQNLQKKSTFSVPVRRWRFSKQSVRA